MNLKMPKMQNGNLLHEGEPALKIVTRVTATKEFK